MKLQTIQENAELEKRTGGSVSRTAERSFVILFGLFALAIAYDRRDGVPFLTDGDDIVRLIQIRELLNGHHWFDMTLGAVSMPESLVSHYSRLVDLPYFLIATMLSPVLGPDAALSAAVLAWPIVLLAIFAGLCIYILQRLYGRQPMIADLALIALVSAMGVLEFTPGRIDHHNVLMVLMAVMLAGFCSPKPIGGLVAGFAISVAVAIGLEVLPNVALAVAALALHAIFRPSASARRLSWTGLGIALAAVPAALASYGPEYAFRGYCDSFASPLILCFAGGGFVLAAVPWIWRATGTLEGGTVAVGTRFLMLAAPSVLVLGAVGVLFPVCLHGPYGAIDPLTRTMWLDRIGQEKSLFAQSHSLFIPLTSLAAMAVFGAILAFPRFRSKIRHGRADHLVAFTLATGCTVIFIAYTRAFNFAAMFAIFLVPAAMEMFRPVSQNSEPADANRGKWRVSAFAALIGIILSLQWAMASHHESLTVEDVLGSDGCQNADFSVLDIVPPGRIVSPLGLANEIAVGHPQHTVEALALHRAAPGIHRMLVAFLSTDDSARKAALAPFDYLAVCARKYVAGGYDEAQLYTKLVGGDAVPGLIPVAGPVRSDFRLYRIDHAALQ
jgi:hypothetical protein